MGTPKVWLPCGNMFLLQRTVEIVGGIARPVVAATQRGLTLPPLGKEVRTVFDAPDTAGPLAGMAAGLEALAGECDAALVVACDHPLLRPSFLTRLIELLDDHPAVVSRHEDHIYPSIGVYRVETRTLLAQMLAAGELRARDFVARCGAYIVPSAELLAADPKLDSLKNVNDRATYEGLIGEIEK